jgi:hypothetical protein
VVVCLAFAFLVPGRGFVGAAIVAALTGLLLGGLITPFVMVTELVPPRLTGTASGVVSTPSASWAACWCRWRSAMPST